ncbi:MAG: hypothetical protein ACR2QO_26755, partial [Acidimicrobiales bacterium]
MTESRLTAPTARDWSMDRPGLITRLESEGPLQLAIAVAPAGYGKTTLLEAWSRHASETTTVGWLSLEEGDNDPVRFWTYLSECLARSGVEVDDDLLDELPANSRLTSDFTTAVAAELARLPGRQLIVIDNLHTIVDRSLLAAIYALAMALPRSAALAVATQSMPPWPVEHLKGSDGTSVLSTTDLRFTRSEVGAVLHQVAPQLHLERNTVDIIHRRTEGWPALVKLTAEGLRHNIEPERLVNTFDGRSEIVSDYLLQEVLDPLPAPVRRFLLELSVVERFSDELAEALVGPLAAGYLHELASAQLINRSAEPGTDGRLHPLVRDLASDELDRYRPGRVRVLNRRAGYWHRTNGCVSLAVEHLLRAEAFDDALAVIDEGMESHSLSGGEETLLRWLDLLPAEELERRPKAASQLARTLAYHGRFDEARGWVELAARGAGTQREQLDAITSGLYLARACGDVEATRDQIATLDELAGQVDDPELAVVVTSRQVESLLFDAICQEALGRTEERRAALSAFEARRS